MKVCTDACILGAWYAARIEKTTSVLDIGSGTGLLMMMLAQQCQAVIHGIEIEEPCFLQLRENIAAGKWAGRMETFYGDVRGYPFPLAYDFIISNPPFYDRDLASPDSSRQLAMHSSALRLDELAAAMAVHLSPGGSAGVLLPYHRAADFDLAATAAGLYATDRLLIRHTEKHQWFRVITTYARVKPGSLSASLEESLSQPGLLSEPRLLAEPGLAGFTDLIISDQKGKEADEGHLRLSGSTIPTWLLTIRNQEGKYTREFRLLMEPYYLNTPG